MPKRFHDKLNEGWDVLNLFDIVRCYSTRDARAGKPGKTTIAEAQLIGRGARYFPFATPDQPDRHQRKFDRNLSAELRVLEELLYNSVNDSRYIDELRTALINEGMIDDREVDKTLNLKDSFKETAFYKYGLIYLNERVLNRYEHIRSFSDMGIHLLNYEYTIATGRGTSGALLQGNGNFAVIAEAGRIDIRVSDMPVHIVRNALARKAFFSLKSLKTYFPHIRSVRQFIEEDAYLGGLSITFQGDTNALYSLTNSDRLAAMTGLLERVESELRAITTKYRGTENFKPYNAKAIFTDKTLKVRKDSERANEDEPFVSYQDWYVFHANYGTSEEKAFVRMLERQINGLTERYDGIYLARNERHFKIYNFDDGQAFEPDFVLFLRKKDGNMLTYQMFFEPKGKHLKEYDRWKEDFLRKVTQKFEGETLEFRTQSKKQTYRLIGVPFYNNEDENAFKQSLYEVVAE